MNKPLLLHTVGCLYCYNSCSWTIPGTGPFDVAVSRNSVLTHLYNGNRVHFCSLANDIFRTQFYLNVMLRAKQSADFLYYIKSEIKNLPNVNKTVDKALKFKGKTKLLISD